MCTVGAAILAVSAISTGMSVYGQIQQGKAADAQYSYQAAVDRNNQIIAGRYADDAIARGKVAEQEQRNKTRQIIARQTVSFAGNNIDLGSESVINTLADTAAYGELDALTVRNNAAREAYGYRVQGMNYAASAQNNLMAGSNAYSAARTSATTSLLSGAASVGKTYVDLKSKYKDGKLWG